MRLISLPTTPSGKQVEQDGSAHRKITESQERTRSNCIKRKLNYLYSATNNLRNEQI